MRRCIRCPPDLVLCAYCVVVWRFFSLIRHFDYFFRCLMDIQSGVRCLLFSLHAGPPPPAAGLLTAAGPVGGGRGGWVSARCVGAAVDAVKLGPCSRLASGRRAPCSPSLAAVRSLARGVAVWGRVGRLDSDEIDWYTFSATVWRGDDVLFSIKSRDWPGRTSPKWPVLCLMGRKTLTQSTTTFWSVFVYLYVCLLAK